MSMWAKYKGILYDASMKSENDVIIRSFNKAETDDSFFVKKYPDGKPIYIKYVAKTELEELYDEHKFGTYKGIEFSINGETEKTYTIWYWYYDDENINSEIEKCESLGMDLYEKGIYTKSVPKSQITNFRIEKEDLLHK